MGPGLSPVHDMAWVAVGQRVWRAFSTVCWTAFCRLLWSHSSTAAAP